MSQNRYAARRDANEGELVKVARQLGVYMVKAPPLDYWACLCSTWKCIEIKARKGKYTPAQILFLAECVRNSAPQLTWRSVDDVIESVNLWMPRALTRVQADGQPWDHTPGAVNFVSLP